MNKYMEGFEIGYRIGYTKVMISLFRNESKMRKVLEDGERSAISNNDINFCVEAEKIAKKYPNYSEKHLIKRILFESTHMPI